jgi:hypothetical protein
MGRSVSAKTELRCPKIRRPPEPEPPAVADQTSPHRSRPFLNFLCRNREILRLPVAQDPAGFPWGACSERLCPFPDLGSVDFLRIIHHHRHPCEFQNPGLDRSACDHRGHVRDVCCPDRRQHRPQGHVRYDESGRLAVHPNAWSGRAHRWCPVIDRGSPADGIRHEAQDPLHSCREFDLHHAPPETHARDQVPNCDPARHVISAPWVQQPARRVTVCRSNLNTDHSKFPQFPMKQHIQNCRTNIL